MTVTKQKADVPILKPKVTRKTSTPRPIEKLAPNPFMYEVLELACKQKTNDKKIEVLREYRDDSIISVFLWNYVPSLVSVLPPGPVPYSALNELDLGNDTLSETVQKQINADKMVDAMGSNQRTSIRNEFRIFYNFLRGGNDGLSSIRRETMFINLLEGLHPKEAEIIILTKDKKLTDRYKLSFELIRDAYPDVIWDR
jgi:hypothetical protein